MNRGKTTAVTLAAAALALSACGTTTGAQAPSPATAQAVAAVTTATPASTPRCATGDLALSLGTMTQTAAGQDQVPLVYQNVSSHPCDLHGAPGVDLAGPNDPAFGPTYSLPRVDDGPRSIVLAPGERGAAMLFLLQDGGWVPNEIVSIPPGQTTPLRVAWPFRFGVLRQDAATHPGTYVYGITALN
ncbi:DUF4232 domain-containing protein [Amycolatopsis sp. GM8]|uniref:DUF4232 domain-containing protein n=1 Tax=Amycolatopsis sp. GM8 TaxID=2896530 RepID=UPI001F348A71|nr:DUF4232 domain-containing protein [Amycolatopsis sp. GM8]